jgi:phosphate transport system ATP-binding protein
LLNGKVIEFSKTKQLFSIPKNKLTEDYINGEFG